MVDRGRAIPTYRRWVPALVAGLTVGTTLAPVVAAAEQLDQRPNVILISADDMRADDLIVMDNLRSL